MQEILSIFHVDAQMLIAQLVNFTVLMVLIVYVVVRPLRKVLAEREEVIKSGIDNAIHAETRLNNATLEANAIVLDAEQSAHVIKSEAHKKAVEIAGAVEQQTIKDHEHMRAVFESELASRRESDLHTFQHESVDIVIDSVRKVLKESFSDSTFSAEYITGITKK